MANAMYSGAAAEDLAAVDERSIGCATERPVRVVIAEDAYLFREAVELVLAATGDVEVVGAVGGATSLLAAVDRDRPDVVVTDIRMPPSGTDEGIRVAHVLRETHRARMSRSHPVWMSRLQRCNRSAVNTLTAAGRLIIRCG